MKPLRLIFSGKTTGAPARDSHESRTSTAVPSCVPSNHQSENEDAAPEESEKKTLNDLGDSSQLSSDQREDESTAAEVVESNKPELTENGEEKKNQEVDADYPTGLPLMIVVVGLCLAILLVALVGQLHIGINLQDEIGELSSLM